jgi:uncharacterized protein YndB with AHSA1/START domain
VNRPEAPTGTDLVVETRVAARPEAVFDYLVEPDKIIRWMGVATDLDPRPGGRFWLDVTGTDIASGTYLEVDPPKRIVFTWGWEGSVEVPPGSTTVTVTLTADGDETVVEVRHAGLPGGAADGHEDGWTYFLSRLAAVSEGGDPGPQAPPGT